MSVYIISSNKTDINENKKNIIMQTCNGGCDN